MIVRFAPKTEFTRTIQRRVAAHLAAQDHRLIRRRMLAKTAIILAWTVTSYVALVFFADGGWTTFFASTSLGLALAGVGFAIQHDANHGAYPVGKRARRALGFCLDLMGGSSYLWRFQHNVNHHTFTNVVGGDNDICIGGIARLSPLQPRRSVHRFQHIYLWPLYSLLAVSWMYWADWRDYVRGAIGENAFPRPSKREKWLFWGGKGIWVGLAFVLPMTLHSWSTVLLVGLWTYLVLGFVLSVVFQLAHVVDEVVFPDIRSECPRSESEFFMHQIATTADFAPDRRLLNWYLGGLNFQIEHHLFPRVCHLHYPALAPIVRQVCEEFGVKHFTYPTLSSALAGHFRWLRTMGQSEASVPSPVAADGSAPSAAGG
ncbi:MAG: acyl-CoA desaturase [Myxococcota bacterium]